MHTRRCIRSERSHRPRRRLLRLGFGGDVLHGVDEVEEKVARGRVCATGRETDAWAVPYSL
jgi:hypothetical protein